MRVERKIAQTSYNTQHVVGFSSGVCIHICLASFHLVPFDTETQGCEGLVKSEMHTLRARKCVW